MRCRDEREREEVGENIAGKSVAKNKRANLWRRRRRGVEQMGFVNASAV